VVRLRIRSDRLGIAAIGLEVWGPDHNRFVDRPNLLTTGLALDHHGGTERGFGECGTEDH